MTPERRKVLTEPRRGTRRLATGSVIALLAAAGLGAVSAPAYADTHPDAGDHPVVMGGGDGHHKKPPIPDRNGECHSIDSWISGEQQFLGVVDEEEIFVGVRGLDPATDPVNWEEITTLDGTAVRNACDVTVAEMGGELFVEAISTTGLVWETTCDVADGNDPELTCEEDWALIDPQPQDD